MMRPTATCTLLASLGLGACGGGASDAARVTFRFPAEIGLRAGEAASITPSIDGVLDGAATFEVKPQLPAGLTLDTKAGALTGSPTASSGPTRHRVALVVEGAEVASFDIDLTIGPALPAGIRELEGGWAAETYATASATKLAVAPDGRVFFTELATGRIRVISAGGNLEASSFASRPVLSGGHRGLLGIALAPDFETSRQVFAMACAPAAGAKSDRVQILRWTEAAGVATDERVLVDDLPIGMINNGGALCFDASGMLLASLGDVQDAAKSQDLASPAGKILRLTRDGGVPADNPTSGSLVYAIGLRNVFALCIEPGRGGIFAADNGPASDDELVFVQAGRNYQWGSASEVEPIGFHIHTWPTVIVPTAIRFHDGTGVDSRYAGNLFLAHYEDEGIRRLELSGADRTDLDSEQLGFCHFENVDGGENKPTDLVIRADGSILVATFKRIYRLWQL